MPGAETTLERLAARCRAAGKSPAAAAELLRKAGATDEDVARLLAGYEPPPTPKVRAVTEFEAASTRVTEALKDMRTDPGAILEAPVLEDLALVAKDPPEWARVSTELRKRRMLAQVQAALKTRTLRLARDDDKPGLRPPTKTYAGLVDLLRTDSRLFDGALEWNDLLGIATIARREMVDHDIGVIRERIERNIWVDGKPLEFTHDLIEKALEQVAHENTYNPLTDYLSGLEWDGVPRLDAFLEEYLGNEDPLPIERLMVRRWFVAAVARAFEPGCKADGVLIFHGEQGKLKSAVFAALGDPWFTDEGIEPKQRDSLMIMRRVWIAEWAELDAIKGRELTAVKAFITRRTDIYRPPYGRRLVTAPRHCVIVGSTNEQDFLTDPTGNRRFWVVRTFAILLTKIRSDRDQLWAEAVHRYRKAEAPEHKHPDREGERWWLDEAETKSLREAQADFERPELGEAQITEWALKQAQPFTMEDCLAAVFELKPHQFAQAKSLQVSTGKVLDKLGFRNARRSIAGSRVPRWYAPDMPIPDMRLEKEGRE